MRRLFRLLACVETPSKDERARTPFFIAEKRGWCSGVCRSTELHTGDRTHTPTGKACERTRYEDRQKHRQGDRKPALRFNDNITPRGGRCILRTLWLSTGKDGSAMKGDVFS